MMTTMTPMTMMLTITIPMKTMMMMSIRNGRVVIRRRRRSSTIDRPPTARARAMDVVSIARLRRERLNDVVLGDVAHINARTRERESTSSANRAPSRFRRREPRVSIAEPERARAKRFVASRVRRANVRAFVGVVVVVVERLATMTSSTFDDIA